jgi:hypothetical protein
MFLVNSRYRHFSATPFSSACKTLHLTGHTFSRSYGVILPSSLTRVLSSALGFSPSLPVSVYGTITFHLARGFSWQHGINHFMRQSLSSSRLGFKRKTDLPVLPAYTLKPPSNRRLTYPSASPHHSNDNWWYRNINLFSIAYAFRPRLRDRLTLSRLALLRKP